MDVVERIELFPRAQVAGVFRGFREGGLEFHADLVLPYRSEFQSTPMHGQFLLVQLQTPDEAVLGRITALSSEGKLALGSGEDFALRAMAEQRAISEDLRAQYLKYRVDIRVLGVLRLTPSGELTFVASHRRLPHVGSHVAFPSNRVLQEITGHFGEGAPLGHLAFGEYVYAHDDATFERLDWMQVRAPQIYVRFPIENLVSRRTFVFARAGFGKSNLNKLLFSQLYQTQPTVRKRGREVPVGTVIFDPDGEYFWPDDKGRPGLCDVPELQDKLVVFTSRRGPSAYYQSFVAGTSRLDLRRFNASDVVSVALPPDRQDQQNVRKLAGLSPERWAKLIALVEHDLNQTPLEEIARLLDLDVSRQEAEALAARANMSLIVRSLHDPSSRLIDMLILALSQGKLCVVDVSQMRGRQALITSGLILRWIFDHNQLQFTEARPKTIPTIAVVEEAQTVLNERATTAEPYIAWVKEGRKYDLGAVLITQQPGSIPTEILSQGDNWFLFHLLSATDLVNVSRANAHFSEDLLSVLLNEPIPGQGVFWSSAGGKPYPIPLRTRFFERMYSCQDADYTRSPVATYAASLKAQYDAEVRHLAPEIDTYVATVASAGEEGGSTTGTERVIDTYALARHQAIAALGRDADLREQLRGNGAPYGRIKKFLFDHLPATFEESMRGQIAYQLVAEAMNTLFGPQGDAWESYMPSGGTTKWVRLKR